jgi:hypothetical protein
MRAGCLVLITIAALFVSAACAREPAQPPYKMVASVEDLMEGVVEPSSEKLFEIGGLQSSASGSQKIAPKDDEEWSQVKHSAMAVAEVGNILKSFEPRAREADWNKNAQDLIDSALAVSKGVDARNPDAVFEAGGHLYDACTACHMKYLPQAEPPPP